MRRAWERSPTKTQRGRARCEGCGMSYQSASYLLAWILISGELTEGTGRSFDLHPHVLLTKPPES